MTADLGVHSVLMRIAPRDAASASRWADWLVEDLARVGLAVVERAPVAEGVCGTSAIRRLRLT